MNGLAWCSSGHSADALCVSCSESGQFAALGSRFCANGAMMSPFHALGTMEQPAVGGRWCAKAWYAQEREGKEGAKVAAVSLAHVLVAEFDGENWAQKAPMELPEPWRDGICKMWFTGEDGEMLALYTGRDEPLQTVLLEDSAPETNWEKAAVKSRGKWSCVETWAEDLERIEVKFGWTAPFDSLGAFLGEELLHSIKLGSSFRQVQVIASGVEGFFVAVVMESEEFLLFQYQMPTGFGAVNTGKYPLPCVEVRDCIVVSALGNGESQFVVVQNVEQSLNQFRVHLLSMRGKILAVYENQAANLFSGSSGFQWKKLEESAGSIPQEEGNQVQIVLQALSQRIRLCTDSLHEKKGELAAKENLVRLLEHEYLHHFTNSSNCAMLSRDSEVWENSLTCVNDDGTIGSIAHSRQTSASEEKGICSAFHNASIHVEVKSAIRPLSSNLIALQLSLGQVDDAEQLAVSLCCQSGSIISVSSTTQNGKNGKSLVVLADVSAAYTDLPFDSENSLTIKLVDKHNNTLSCREKITLDGDTNLFFTHNTEKNAVVPKAVTATEFVKFVKDRLPFYIKLGVHISSARTDLRSFCECISLQQTSEQLQSFETWFEFSPSFTTNSDVIIKVFAMKMSGAVHGLRTLVQDLPADSKIELVPLKEEGWEEWMDQFCKSLQEEIAFCDLSNPETSSDEAWRSFVNQQRYSDNIFGTLWSGLSVYSNRSA